MAEKCKWCGNHLIFSRSELCVQCEKEARAHPQNQWLYAHEKDEGDEEGDD